jgi:hypothetical protein
MLALLALTAAALATPVAGEAQAGTDTPPAESSLEETEAPGLEETEAPGLEETEAPGLEETEISAPALELPPQLIPGIVYYEAEDQRWWKRLGEEALKKNKDWTVSLGVAQIEVRRAAELLYPNRIFKEQPLTSVEFDEIVARLESEEECIAILTMALFADYEFYGRVPGKTEKDRWRFALAKHKGGHGVVGPAQVTVNNKGKNSNRWATVSNHMDPEVVSFVEKVWSYDPTNP